MSSCSSSLSYLACETRMPSYSLRQANRIEPYAYLRTVFTELPNATTVEEIEALLPVPTDGDSLAKVS